MHLLSTQYPLGRDDIGMIIIGVHNVNKTFDLLYKNKQANQRALIVNGTWFNLFELLEGQVGILLNLNGRDEWGEKKKERGYKIVLK